jgi:hypothetical protein
MSYHRTGTGAKVNVRIRRAIGLHGPVHHFSPEEICTLTDHKPRPRFLDRRTIAAENLIITIVCGITAGVLLALAI